jgi:hypothetical protein
MNGLGNQPMQVPPPPPPASTKKWIWWVVGIIGGCLILSCCIALIAGIFLYTQGKLDLPFLSGLSPNAPALSGEGSLDTGFTPDPYTSSITGGGTIDVSKLTLGTTSGCLGYVTKAPTFSLNWTGTSSQLRIFSVANDGTDTTMIVRDPSGNWYCNDDSIDGGWDPMLDFPNAGTGQYDIWLGNYTSGGGIPATLYVTELGYNPLDPTGTNSNSTGALDLGAEPTYGTTDLASGFLPDPFQMTLLGGGGVDIYSANIGPDCTGYAASTPDYRINFSGSSPNLRIFFVSDSGVDTTLIVNDATASWFCNDDFTSDSGDPLVDIPNPTSGQIDIWVGTYTSGEFASGTLYVTESNITPLEVSGGTPGDSGALDFSLEPTYGSGTIGNVPTSDPILVDLPSGGPVEVSTLDLGPDCTGYAASAPDFRFQYAGSTSRLRIFFVSADGSDTTMIVNTPDSSWVCNDDDPVSGTTNPMVEIASPLAGQYDVWVGTYSSSSSVFGTLYITEQDFTPTILP